MDGAESYGAKRRRILNDEELGAVNTRITVIAGSKFSKLR